MLLNRLNTSFVNHQVNEYQVSNVPESNFKSRIIVKKGNEYIAMKVDEIALFYSLDKMVYVIDRNGKKYLLETTLSRLEECLDSKIFYRANRQYIISIDYIKSFKAFEKVKLQVVMNVPDFPTPIIISQVTATHFRKWIQQI